jgi:hypothetical protein
MTVALGVRAEVTSFVLAAIATTPSAADRDPERRHREQKFPSQVFELQSYPFASCYPARSEYPGFHL